MRQSAGAKCVTKCANVLLALVRSKLFTPDELNSRISGFAYGQTDVTSKPSLLTGLDKDSHGLQQKAFQFYCLFRLLPFMIGDLVPPGNEHWAFFLELRKCADYLFAQKWTNGTAAQFGYLWELHLRHFKRLFPDSNLLPKHHFLLHYGTTAIMTGPPYKNMVASQEMKGNFLKRSAHVMCNFKNVPHTLAWRMQFYANNCLLAGKFDKDAVGFNRQTDVNLCTLPCLNQISQMLDVCSLLMM